MVQAFLVRLIPRKVEMNLVTLLLWSFALVVAAASLGHAQSQNGGSSKLARAVRVPNGSIELDGDLVESVWSQAPPVIDFLQKDPIEGASPADPMEVRFVYDDNAMYVGARMFSSNPGAIQAPMSRRDEVQAAEHLRISLDTYRDRRTAYTFGVTASGVRVDEYHPGDNEHFTDETFDPVWRVRTRIDEQGWTAEFWLPFSQLRFNTTDEMVWGLNIHRWTPTLNEDDYWVMVPRTERGWSSRFGDLTGFEGVRSPRRLELRPYVASSSRLTGDPDPADPFDERLSSEARVGLDLKMSLGSNLNLDATINPDFGQVEADPAEVNLSTVESFFEERRPFFQEGNRLLQGPIQNLYYSRRIGARPSVDADGEYVDSPDASTILGAAKITGRLASGTSIGALTAVTSEEFADSFESGTDQFFRTRVAPRTFYAVSRVQQEFGEENSTYAMQFTAVNRDLNETDPLAQELVQRAFTGTADTQIRFGDGMYAFESLASVTSVTGEPAAIEDVQRDSAHRFQRPDRPQGIRLDPTRRSLSGTRLSVGLDKFSGEHWLWGTSLAGESPEFETSDLGRLNDTADLRFTANLNYRESTPGRLYRSYSLRTNSSIWSYPWDTGLGRQYSLNQNFNWTWANYLRTNFGWSFTSRFQDPGLTRGGPTMQTPRNWNVDGSFGNAFSSQTRWFARVDYGWNEFGDSDWDFGGNFSVRPAPSLQISISPDYSREVNSRQYVDEFDGGRAETYGKRYVFGMIHRSTLSMRFRLNYTFRPDLNLDFYAEPFAASGRYDQFGELAEAKSRLLRIYGEDGTTIARQPDGASVVTDGAANFMIDNEDFNVRSFRSNLVLRWEWRPGSTLYLVWQQDRSREDTTRHRAGLRDMFGSLTAPGDNFFALKADFWISTR